MNLTEIETKTKKFASARADLCAAVETLNAQIEALKQKHLAAIKYEVGRTAHYESELRAAIEAAPELFEKPRTHIFHGIKVGYRKGSGGIDWDDDERVAELAKKHFPELFDVLIKTTHKPQAKAIAANLDIAGAKKIACRVESTGDVLVIKPTDSEVDKVVAALLKGATDEAQKEAA